MCAPGKCAYVIPTACAAVQCYNIHTRYTYMCTFTISLVYSSPDEIKSSNMDRDSHSESQSAVYDTELSRYDIVITPLLQREVLRNRCEASQQRIIWIGFEMRSMIQRSCIILSYYVTFMKIE